MIHEPLKYRDAGVDIEPDKPLSARMEIAIRGTCRDEPRAGIDGIDKRLILARIGSVGGELYP